MTLAPNLTVDINLDDWSDDDTDVSLAEVDEARRTFRNAQQAMELEAIEYRRAVRRFANTQIARGLSKREIANLCGLAESSLRDLLRTDTDGEFVHRKR